MLLEQLGIPFDRIRLLQGDSDQLIAGGGTGGSKSIMASGAAICEASDQVIEKGRQIAGARAGGRRRRHRVPRRPLHHRRHRPRASASWSWPAELRAGIELPPDVPDTLDVDHVFEQAPSAYPNGCHVAEVEIDPDTGTIEVVRYVMVNDFGMVINPLLVEGQAHGGVVQGIGQALWSAPSTTRRASC